MEVKYLNSFYIVLLILTGATIATLTGENGILTRVTEASKKTEEAKEVESRRLTALEAAMNTEGTTHTDNSRNEEVQETVTIPAEFAFSRVEGENTIADGLVIIDKKRNEFVWVPVNNLNEFIREDFENQNISANKFFYNHRRQDGYYEPDLDDISGTTKETAYNLFIFY